MYICTQDMYAYVHTFCMYICCVVVYMCVPHLLHSRGSSEEQVPLSVRDLPGLPQDVGTEHEGEDQFVLLKETPVDVGVCVGGGVGDGEGGWRGGMGQVCSRARAKAAWDWASH